MIQIQDVIIVEGLSDKNYLSTFIQADILTCNGSAMDGFSMDYLKELSKIRKTMGENINFKEDTNVEVEGN